MTGHVPVCRYGRLAAIVVAAAIAAAVTAADGADRPMTFEGGETAPAAADDTVYVTEEVAALNGSAAHDYDEYDDYGPASAAGSNVTRHVAANDTVTGTPVTATAGTPVATAVTPVAGTPVATTFATTTDDASATTESGVIAQIARPPGYDGAAAATTTAATPPATAPASFAVTQCRPAMSLLVLAAVTSTTFA